MMHAKLPPSPFSLDPRRPSRRSHTRKGNILVLTAFLMIVLLALTAFAIDVGYMMVIRTELQRTADAAALAAAWELTTEEDVLSAIPRARAAALDYAGRNPVGLKSPGLDTNSQNDVDGDVVIGQIVDFHRWATLDRSNPEQFNAVQVRVRRDELQNGQVPLFFARILGRDRVSLQAVATAAVTRNISGFRDPPLSQPLPILPIAIELTTWEKIIAPENTQDVYTWDADLKEVTSGRDDVGEGHLYPTITGAPGNFGTLNIGANNNSASHLSDQILNGLSKADLDYHGGELRLDENGQLHLNGDPGISSTIVSELKEIIGQPRIIPVYNELVESGSNAVYTIIGFAGMRIMDVRRQGMKMEVIVQAADVTSGGTIPGSGEQKSQFVFSNPRLVK